MKSLLLSVAFLVSVSALSQVSSQVVPITGQQYKLLSLVKANEAFDKIVIPDKVTTFNDANGYQYSFYNWDGKDVKIYADDHIEITYRTDNFIGDTKLFFEGERLYGFKTLKVLATGDNQLWYFDGKKQVYNKTVKNGK